jgi:hypothetical protein
LLRAAPRRNNLASQAGPIEFHLLKKSGARGAAAPTLPLESLE